MTSMDTENASLRHAAAESAVVTGQLFNGEKMQKGTKPKQMVVNERASQSMDSSLDVQAGTHTERRWRARLLHLHI